MQMNVAHFSFEYPPSTTGGLGIYLEGLVKYQRRLGDNVDVFFLDDGKSPDRTISFPFYRNEKLVSYSLDQINERSDVTQYDVIVCQDWAGIFASQPLWKQPIPLITTCHLPLSWDVGDYADLPCKFAMQLEFMAMARSDLIIAVSDAVRQQLVEDYSFTEGKITIIHNGTDTSFFTPGIKPHQPIVLYVGRFFENKGFDLLPDIFFSVKDRHPNALLKVIGVGPLKADVLEKFSRFNLRDSVRVYDFSPLERVLELYREAAVVVVPSRYESFGLTVVESMATATPVVASNVGGLREIITDGVDGFLVPANDVMSFVDAISFLLSDQGLARQIGKRAREKVIQNFSQRACFEKTRSMYINLTKSGREI